MSKGQVELTVVFHVHAPADAYAHWYQSGPSLMCVPRSFPMRGQTHWVVSMRGTSAASAAVAITAKDAKASCME